MRLLKIIGHISPDSVIQVSGDDGDFPVDLTVLKAIPVFP